MKLGLELEKIIDYCRLALVARLGLSLWLDLELEVDVGLL